MSDFQTGVVVGAASVLAPLIMAVVFALVVQYQEKLVVDRAREAGL